jgi:YfiH family protein
LKKSLKNFRSLDAGEKALTHKGFRAIMFMKRETEVWEMAFFLRKVGGVGYLVSDLLVSVHGFATRLGGVSELAHTASLNLAFGRGDGEAVVLENLGRFGSAVGFDPLSVVSVPQVHGTEVFTVDACHRGVGYYRPADVSGDGYVTADPSVTLGVKTADCTPILLEAEVCGRVVAVGALHAGWRGTVADMAGQGVRTLARLASQAAGVSVEAVAVRAAIGPCIHACCMEVKEDCLSVVRSSLGALADGFIRSAGERTCLDIPGMNRALLLRAGVPAERIDVCELCTACHSELFYSHRASGGVRGTMLNVIRLP